MPHDIDTYDHYVATDSIVWPFLVEEDGTAKDLSSASIEYVVVPTPGDPDGDAILSHTDSGVSVDVEPSAPAHPDAPDDPTGYVEISIGRGEFDRGGEALWQRVRILDDGDGQWTFGGDWFINPA